MNMIHPPCISSVCNIVVKSTCYNGLKKSFRKDVYRNVQSRKLLCRNKISRLRGSSSTIPKIHVDRMPSNKIKRAKSIEKECAYPQPIESSSDELESLDNSANKCFYILLEVRRYMPHNISWFSRQILRLLYDIDYEVVTLDPRFAIMGLEFQTLADQRAAFNILQGVKLSGESIPLEPKPLITDASLENLGTLESHNS